MKKLILFLMTIALIAASSFADEVTIRVGDIDKTITDLPTDLVNLINKNLPKINDAIEKYEITSAAIDDAINSGAIHEVKEFYTKNGGDDYTPITTITEGLNGFSKDLASAIPNTQLMQDVWPEAWIGMFFPYSPDIGKKGAFHIGAGANAGVAQLRIGSLKTAAKALDLNIGNIPNSLVFPTITADLRIGGIVLPFDFGFTVMKLDTRKMKKIDKLLNPSTFDYFTIGFDARWALLKGKGWLPKVSVGLGYYFSSGNLNVADGDTKADTKFKTSNFYLQAQISEKLLFFIPYVGVKFGFTKSNVKWTVTPDWNNILGTDAKISGVSLQELEILPTNFDGGYNGFKFVTQFFGGFAFDFYIGQITFVGGYDIANKNWSAGANFRIAW